MSKKYSIEYSHIYVTQAFGPEQLKSLELMKSREIELLQEGHSIARHVLIDDYSTATGLDRFDETAYFDQLKSNDANPDVVVLESAFTEACEELVSKITDKSIRKSLLSYYETRKKWPCSLCVATWYMMRLGNIPYNKADLASDQIISILPDRFKTPEEEAIDIIAASEFKDSISDIEVIFFESNYNGYSDWSEFDAEEYASRNYLRQVLPEDKTIINFVADYLEEHCQLGSLKLVADIGTGPNAYPSLLVRPYLSQSGFMKLLEPVEANRQFLTKVVAHPTMWNAFEELLHDKNPVVYNMPARPPDNITVGYGDIFDLEQSKYDVVMSFFVAELITDEMSEVTRAMESLKAAVKPGGLLITAHMLGSVGYFAGMLTSFPATPIKEDDLSVIYSDFEDVKILTTSHNKDYDPRKGYKGMAVVAGIKPQIQ